jgi:formate hydrogenlyase subunit 5
MAIIREQADLAASVIEPEGIDPAAFAATLGECAAAGGRLLALCRLPDDRVGAVCDTPAGLRAWSAEAADPERPITRPSTAGLIGALHEEALLAEGGVTWASSAPQVHVRGAGVFTFPLGPVRADVAESAAWRLLVMGDEVLGLHMGFGYKRRALEEAMAAAGPWRGIEVAERVTGTSVVAHATAYAQAWEAALGLAPSPATAWWRTVLGELERLYSHIGDLASLASSTGLPVAAAELLLLKEDLLRANQELTGHRYLRGIVGVGGLRRPPEARALDALAGGRLVGLLRTFRAIIEELDGSTSFLDRLHGAGRIPPAWAAAVQPVGPVGRAAGVPYDVRHDRPYALYAEVGAPDRAVESEADSWARYRVRVREVEASAAWLLARLAARRPSDLAKAKVDRREGPPPSLTERPAIALGRAEGPRGEVVYLVAGDPATERTWVRTRPASAVNWSVLPPAVAENNVLQDVPIIDASFGLSVSAIDR